MAICVEFAAKNIIIDNKNIKLQIWDTVGKETFRSIAKSYLKCAVGVILVFDLTNIESFTSINY
jgi:GTPase SAR1 family protein